MYPRRTDTDAIYSLKVLVIDIVKKWYLIGIKHWITLKYYLIKEHYALLNVIEKI